MILYVWIIDSFMKSGGHRPVLINDGVWRDYEWTDVGAYADKNFATIWFGGNRKKRGANTRALEDDLEHLPTELFHIEDHEEKITLN